MLGNKFSSNGGNDLSLHTGMVLQTRDGKMRCACHRFRERIVHRSGSIGYMIMQHFSKCCYCMTIAIVKVEAVHARCNGIDPPNAQQAIAFEPGDESRMCGTIFAVQQRRDVTSRQAAMDSGNCN